MTVGITELPPEGMQLGGVALAGDADRGTKTTEGLSLLFTTAGITVQGPQPQIERLLVWSGLDSASCREKIDLPDGRNAAVMELTSGGQSIRFLLPMDAVTPGQAAYLDQALPAWLARYKGTAAPVVPAPAPAPAARSPTAGRRPRPASPGGQWRRSRSARARPRTRGRRHPVRRRQVAGRAGGRGRRWDRRVEQQRDGAGSGRLGVGDDRDRRSGGSAGTTRHPPAPRAVTSGRRPAHRPPMRPARPGPVPARRWPIRRRHRSWPGRRPDHSPPADAPPPPPGLVGRRRAAGGDRVGHTDRTPGRAHRMGESSGDRRHRTRRPIRPSDRDPGGRAVPRPNPRGRRPSSSHRCGRRPNRRPTPPPSS